MASFYQKVVNFYAEFIPLIDMMIFAIIMAFAIA